MNKISEILIYQSTWFSDKLNYKSHHCYDKITGEEIPQKLSTLQKLCNIAVDEELVGFVDRKGDPYLFLGNDVNNVANGDIIPLRSEDSKNYFQANYISLWGPCKGSGKNFSKSLDGFLSILESLCLASKYPSLFQENTKGGANE